MTPRTLLWRITKLLSARSLPVWQIAAELNARPQDVLSICITLDVKGRMKQTGDEWTMSHEAPRVSGGYSVFSVGVA